MLNVEKYPDQHNDDAICVRLLLLLRQTLNWDKWEETVVLKRSTGSADVQEGLENYILHCIYWQAV